MIQVKSLILKSLTLLEVGSLRLLLVSKNRKKDTGEDLFTGYKFPSTLGVKHSNSTEYNKKN